MTGRSSCLGETWLKDAKGWNIWEFPTDLFCPKLYIQSPKEVTQTTGWLPHLEGSHWVKLRKHVTQEPQEPQIHVEVLGGHCFSVGNSWKNGCRRTTNIVGPIHYKLPVDIHIHNIDLYRFSILLGFHTSQVVQFFAHQLYIGTCFANLMISIEVWHDSRRERKRWNEMRSWLMTNVSQVILCFISLQLLLEQLKFNGHFCAAKSNSKYMLMFRK